MNNHSLYPGLASIDYKSNIVIKENDLQRVIENYLNDKYLLRLCNQLVDLSKVEIYKGICLNGQSVEIIHSDKFKKIEQKIKERIDSYSKSVYPELFADKKETPGFHIPFDYGKVGEDVSVEVLMRKGNKGVLIIDRIKQIDKKQI